MRKGWRGYISSRPQGEGFVPQRVQNLVIRDYAARNDLLYLLSAVEYAMADCHMVLASVLAEAERLEGIIFYSTHLLPENEELRCQIYDGLLGKGGALRFALEELLVHDPTEIAVLEELLMVRSLTRRPARGMLEVIG